MWKPGTRIVKIAPNPLPRPPWQHWPSLPIGACAVVSSKPVHALNLARGCDFSYVPDGGGEVRCGWSSCWVEFKDPTSAESFLRQLTQPKVNA